MENEYALAGLAVAVVAEGIKYALKKIGFRGKKLSDLKPLIQRVSLQTIVFVLAFSAAVLSKVGEEFEGSALARETVATLTAAVASYHIIFKNLKDAAKV